MERSLLNILQTQDAVKAADFEMLWKTGNPTVKSRRLKLAEYHIVCGHSVQEHKFKTTLGYIMVKIQNVMFTVSSILHALT